MATVNTPAQMDGLFKEIYASGIENLLPDVAVLTKLVKFSQQDKLGNFYHQPVVVTTEQGVTYSGPKSGAFSLLAPIAMTMQDAEVIGFQMALRSRISYDTAAAATSSGKGAFMNVMNLVVENMLESLTKRLEISMLYGQDGIATVASSANASATSTVLTITDAEWATGIWAGAENATLQCYNGATLIGGANSVVTVDSVNVDAKTVTISGVAAGITAIDAAILANPNVVKLFFNGSVGTEMPGLKKILTNTGVLFNVDAGQYNLWRGNTATVTGPLTMHGILRGVDKAVQRGLNEKVTVLVNPSSWSDLNNDLAAQRMFDSSYTSTKGTNGVQSIRYYGQNGEIEIVSHTCVKQGDAFIVPVNRLKRIGAVDFTFTTPGQDSEKFFFQLPDNAGYELRLYSYQSIFLETPARATYISGIVPATV